MIVHDVLQRSPEWIALRLGKLTGTGAAAMMARIKVGEAAARRDLRTRLVLERLTGRSHEDEFLSREMQHGTDREADALMAYEAATGQVARTVGFVAHDMLAAGCSPDGVVGDFAGLLEIKCPKAATHLKYLRTGKVPGDYLHQIVHNLWITGARWADFVSFDDRFPAPLHFCCTRVDRDEGQIAAYELMARSFLTEVEREHDELRARMAA